MKNNNEHKYFQVPLCLLQNIHNDHENGYDRIIAYGLLNYAMKIKVVEADAARQLIYDYYNANYKIENTLCKSLKNYFASGAISFSVDNSDYREYKDFYPKENVEELLKVFIQDNGLKEKGILHCQINCIQSFSKNKFGKIDDLFELYKSTKKMVEEHENKFGADAQAGVKIDTLIEFKEKNNKRENEILCGYIAINSLIGNDLCKATNKSVILMRMIGAKTNIVLQESLKQRELKLVFEKYSKRYHMDALIEKLVDRNFVQSKISFGRKIFVSKKLDFNALSDVIKGKIKKKLSKKSQEKSARQEINEYIKQIKNGAEIQELN